MRETLIANGVRNLKDFGYPNVTADNILTDPIYREFFRGVLGDWMDHPKAQVKLAASALMGEIAAVSDTKGEEIR